jgi:PTH2 family peptidyl-tRNA hydrolase
MNRPVMYLIANKGLGMSAGKLAAQVAHAAVRATMFQTPSEVSEWFEKGETKIVLEARDAEHLILAQTYLDRAGFRSHLVIDEGHTEVPPLSATALGVELVDKADEQVKFTFETFKTYKEPSVAELGSQVKKLVAAIRTETKPRQRRDIAQRYNSLRIADGESATLDL